MSINTNISSYEFDYKRFDKKAISRRQFIMDAETIQMVLGFRDARDWAQFHNPKDLAISISLEAAELLEVFQWSGTDCKCVDKIEKIKEELADVLNYCILMADACNLDMNAIIREKVIKNNEKYPVNKAKGISNKYNELQDTI